MRLLIHFSMSILLGAVAVVALPMAPNPPGDWGRYVPELTGKVPPYSPPDIGPRELDAKSLADIPGISNGQRGRLKVGYSEWYDMALYKIAHKYPEQPPPPEYVEEVKKSIISEWTIRSMQRRRQKKLAVEEAAAGKSKEEIQKELQNQHQLRDDIILRRCSVKAIAEQKKKELEKARAQMNECAEEVRSVNRRIRELEKMLKVAKPKSSKGGTLKEADNLGKPTEFSLKGLQDDANLWAQRAGGFVQDIVHRTSVGGQLRTGAGANLRPYGALPKFSPVLP